MIRYPLASNNSLKRLIYSSGLYKCSKTCQSVINPKVDFISLPNLIADKKIVTELIQQDCTVESIKTELDKLLNTSNLNFYEALFEKIGEKGASENAAKLIINETVIK